MNYYYTKYVEPIIGNLKPLFEKKDFKDEITAEYIKVLKKEVSSIKSPLFNLKTRKNQFESLSHFFYYLYLFYRLNILTQYNYFIEFNENKQESTDFVSIKPHESGDKKKASVHRTIRSGHDKMEYDFISSSMDGLYYGMDMKRIPKKYRTLLGRQFYRDAINVHKSDSVNNASKLYLVPKKGANLRELADIIDHLQIARDVNEDTLEYFLEHFRKLSKSMRFRDADSANNTVRAGAQWLEKELAEELQGQKKIEKATKRLSETKKYHKGLEEHIQQEIEKQQKLIEKLKADAQKKMTDVVNDGAEVKIAAFKTTQIKVNKVVAAQQKLIELKNKLKEIKERFKREEAESVKAVKSEIADHFYGLKR